MAPKERPDVVCDAISPRGTALATQEGPSAPLGDSNSATVASVVAPVVGPEPVTTTTTPWINPDWRSLADDRSHLAIALNVARHWAYHYPIAGDEYESEAWVALCRIAMAYRPEIATRPFPVYLRTRMNHAMNDVRRIIKARGFSGLSHAIRDGRFKVKVASLDKNRSNGIESYEAMYFHVDLNDIVVDYRSIDDYGNEYGTGERHRLDHRRDFEVRIRYLPPRHRCVMRLLYLEGLTMKATASEMGLCEGRICGMHREAVEMLRGVERREREIQERLARRADTRRVS